jgi:hypothetical protein
MLHIAEDYRMTGVPTPQDFLKHMEVQAWMNNGVKPIPSQESKEAVTDLLERLREDRQEVETV